MADWSGSAGPIPTPAAVKGRPDIGDENVATALRPAQIRVAHRPQPRCLLLLFLYRSYPMQNLLAFTDQTSWLLLRATGQGPVIQCVWVYERAVDLDGVRRFHRNLGLGLLGRRIECSPLPFARHRWVSCPAPSAIDIADRPRPRAELSAWADERGQLVVDPQLGPGWHLGVAAFTDGSAAVSLVASHTLVDGMGLCRAIADAVLGATPQLGYPPPHSRTRTRAVLQDAYQTARDAPQAARALATAAHVVRRRRAGGARSRASSPVAIRRGAAHRGAPAISIYIDLDDWDYRAKSLGGTSNSLFAGFAAKLAERSGFHDAAAGTVRISFPVSDRIEGDTRANALSFVIVDVEPARVTTTLREVRGAISRELQTLRETPEELLGLLALSPFTPKRVARKLAETAYGYPDVGCSNLGDLDPAVGRPDGTDADRVFIRGLRQQLTPQGFERPRGILLVSGRIGAKIFITVVAYHLAAKNPTPGAEPNLRELAAHTLAEFGLTGVID
ncbi:MAG: hypothetical protein QJR12_08555 [Mycobacterium sp.]|uniref:hypothetical protein n=1 Tax=Mycobacterium sp. TaxID=1785 RepID=UPI00260C076F|nr:hypothetical protein [Mycobacterium sp.]MDI3314314.1 hypothetical protein [Mycobacterium sp.]